MASASFVAKVAGNGGSLASLVNVITTPLHVVAVVGQADVVVVVSQPMMTLLVESTRVAVVSVADTPKDVVVRIMVADSVSHDVGSSE